MRSTCVLLAALLGVNSGASAADRLQLANGDTLTGTLSSVTKEQLVLASPILGDLTIPMTQVATVNGEPVEIRNGDTAASVEPASPVDLGGQFALSMDKDEGASESEEYEVRLENILTRGLNVIALTFEYESESTQDDVTEEEYEIDLKAERFVTSADTGHFWYARGAWNKDRFRATDQWVAIGAGAGYVWRPTTGTYIKLQGGVDAWRISLQDEDRRATGGRLLLDMRHTFADLANMIVFSEATMLWELDGRRNQVLETTSGLRLPFTQSFFAEVSLDYDRFEAIDAPEFSEDDETEWKFRLGYRW